MKSIVTGLVLLVSIAIFSGCTYKTNSSPCAPKDPCAVPVVQPVIVDTCPSGCPK